jgi:hypothetical protein
MGQPKSRSRSPVTRTVVIVLLLVATAGTLAVPIYARATPKLGAFPFFYWYQLVWVPGVAVLSWLAYLLINTGRSPVGRCGGSGEGKHL